jgi:hypothetical protein
LSSSSTRGISIRILSVVSSGALRSFQCYMERRREGETDLQQVGRNQGGELFPDLHGKRHSYTVQFVRTPASYPLVRCRVLGGDASLRSEIEARRESEKLEG